MRAAHEHRFQRSGLANVGEEAAFTLEQALVLDACERLTDPVHDSDTCGRVNAVTGGAGARSGSTSTRVVCAAGVCASCEVAWSRVTTFGFPCFSKDSGLPGVNGSYHAPVATWTTPRRSPGWLRTTARFFPTGSSIAVRYGSRRDR